MALFASLSYFLKWVFLQCTMQASVNRWRRLYCTYKSRSRIHECTISLRFLGIILRVLRLKVSNSIYVCRGDCEKQGGKVSLKTFVPITSKNSASVQYRDHLFTVSVVFNGFYPKTGTRELLITCSVFTQLAPLALVLNIFLLTPVFFIE
jgi:hypothetical protein